MNLTGVPLVDDLIYKHLHKACMKDVCGQLDKIKNYHKNHNAISDGSNEQYEIFNNICFNFYSSNYCRITMNDIQMLLNQF
jgi:hypothetical protein